MSALLELDYAGVQQQVRGIAKRYHTNVAYTMAAQCYRCAKSLRNGRRFREGRDRLLRRKAILNARAWMSHVRRLRAAEVAQ